MEAKILPETPVYIFQQAKLKKKIKNKKLTPYRRIHTLGSVVPYGKISHF